MKIHKNKLPIIAKSSIALLCCCLVTIVFWAQQTNETGSAKETLINSQTFGALSQDEQASYIDSMPTADNLDEKDEGSAYVRGYVVARFKESPFDGDLLSANAINYLGDFVSLDTKGGSGFAKVDDRTALLKVRDNVSVSKAVSELNNSSAFNVVQPNYIYTLSETTNDPDVSKQVQIDEELQATWDLQKTEGEVTVAVLDSGIDQTHEDLHSNIREATTRIWELDYSNLPNYYWDTSEPDDKSPKSHGTHCSGIISAVSNNAVGISGVSYNAKILSIRVFKNRSSSTSSTDQLTSTSTDICGAIDYAISKKSDYNLRIISMSLGHVATADTAIDDQLYSDKIDEATEAGITCVAASGNESKAAVSFPAASSNAIAVGACDSSGSRCYFSNYGPELDVVAPGWSIYSTITGSYGSLSGTSMATPYVSGVIALMYAANPNLTPSNVYKILTATATRSQGQFTNEYGYGKVSPLNAIKAAQALDDGTAQTCAVYFNGVGADNTPVGQVVKSGERVVIPEAVVKSGYHLEGWYTDSTYQTKWDFFSPVTSDITLWAKWGSAQCNHSDTYGNHLTATCTSGGYKIAYCNSCGWKTQDVSFDALGHTFDDVRITLAATCISEGSQDIYCSRCGQLEQSGVVIPIDENAHGDIEILKGAEPTCTDSGVESGRLCNACSKIIKEQTSIAPLGHLLVLHSANEPTCLRDGNDEYYECLRSECMKNFTVGSDGTATEILDVTLPALGHDMVHVSEVAATCESAGIIEHYHCNRENVNFTLDEQGQYVEKSDITTPALGHRNLSEVVKSNATCSHEGELVVTCGVCQKSWSGAIERNANIHENTVAKEVVEATCVQSGVNEVSCVDCGSTWLELVGKNNNVHKHVELRDVVEATCVKDSGYSGDTWCTDCMSKIASGSHTTDASNHVNVVSLTSRVEPTCSSVGWSGAKICTAHSPSVVVSENVEIPINPDNHVNLTKIEAQSATCVKDGHSEYEVCECGKEFNKTIVLKESAAHIYSEGICTLCGAADPDYVPKTFAPNIAISGGGSVTLDKDSYIEGDIATMSVRGASFGDNIIMPKSVVVDGVTRAGQSDLVNKTAWQSENLEYKRRMGQSAKSIEFANVAGAIESPVQIKIDNLREDMKIEVIFEEVVPVYRLYNMITSEHLFTTNRAEYEGWVAKSKSDEDVWIGEGINWFASSTPTEADDNTVRRLYNKTLGALGRSSHYYSKDKNEIANLLKSGWVDDGVDNYIQSGGDIPIWTCYNEALGSAHHYTSSFVEWASLSSHGWDLESDKNGSTGVFRAIMSAL